MLSGYATSSTLFVSFWPFCPFQDFRKAKNLQQNTICFEGLWIGCVVWNGWWQNIVMSNPPKARRSRSDHSPTVANRSSRICSLILRWHYTGTIGYKGNLAGGLNLTHLASLNQRTREVGDDEFCFRMTSSVVWVMFVSGSLGRVVKGVTFTFHVIQHLLVFIVYFIYFNFTYSIM